jgi:hypothetical protein
MYLEDVPPLGQPVDPMGFMGLRFRIGYTQWKSGDRVQPRLQTLQPALGALLPDIIEAVVFSPCDLVEDFAVKPVGGLAPLRWVAEG